MSGSEHQAWSTLRTLLAEKNLTVVDLHEKLREQGFEVNKKAYIGSLLLTQFRRSIQLLPGPYARRWMWVSKT